MILFWPKEYIGTCEQGEEELWSVIGRLGQPCSGSAASRSEQQMYSRCAVVPGAGLNPFPMADCVRFFPALLSVFSYSQLGIGCGGNIFFFFFFYRVNWPGTQISTFLPFRERLLNITSTPLHVDHLFPSLIHGRPYQWIPQHVPSWSTGEAQNPFQYVFQAVMTSELVSPQGIKLTQ